MFSLFSKKKKEFGTGALTDIRSAEAKSKDFRYEELAGATTPTWTTKTTWKKYPVFNQDGSSSCVAQACTKALGINNYNEEGHFIHLSARDLYARRTTPGGGMWGAEACNIAREFGATVECLMPSQEMNEELMNSTVDRTPSKVMVAKLYRAKNWVALPFNIDSIAAVLDQGYGVVLFFRFEYAEWDKPDPMINPTVTNPSKHHAVCAVDYMLKNGQKVLVIDESWGSDRGANGQRFVTEDWINKRCTWASYFVDLSLLEQVTPTKITFIFTKTMRVGDSHTEVAMLQRCLSTIKDSAGFLFPPLQTVTGYFGGITQKAVERFQVLHNLNPDGIVGAKTIAKLNEVFAP